MKKISGYIFCLFTFLLFPFLMKGTEKKYNLYLHLFVEGIENNDLYYEEAKKTFFTGKGEPETTLFFYIDKEKQILNTKALKMLLLNRISKQE